MIRSKTNESYGAMDALNIWGEIHPIQGQTTQMYYASTDTYESDRRYTPLVLMGEFFVNDPTGVMTGAPTIYNIEWYHDEVKAANRITAVVPGPDPTTEDYLISDGQSSWCAGVPKWGLIIHKNVSYNDAMQIIGVMSFVDSRTGDIVRKQSSVSLSTEYYDDIMLKLEGNRGDEWVLDPLNFPEPLTSGHDVTAEAWQRTASTQLRKTGVDVPDNAACYLWVIRDANAANGWREFNATEKSTLVVSGYNTKTLTLDVRYIDRSIQLRCFACEREADAAWVSPFVEGNPFYECRVVVEMNDKASITINQTKGFEQGYNVNSTCHYDARLMYGPRQVPSNKNGLFSITWRGVNLQTFETVTLGTGMSVEFVPSAKGFAFPDGFAVYAEARTFRTKTSAGAIQYNNSMLVRSKSIYTTVNIDPLTIFGELVILQGNNGQCYYVTENEYEPDRRYTPLVLMGQFFVNDPLGEVSSQPAITGIEWYDDVPLPNDYNTHRIKNPDDPSIYTDPDRWRNVDFLISDGSDAAWCAGVPQYGLIVHKNLRYPEAMQIYAVIKFLDTRTNTTVRKQCSINLSSEAIQDNNIIVLGDRGDEWVLDPLNFPEPLTSGNDITDEPWLRTISAQLRFDGEDVADADALYTWVVKDDSVQDGWREFNDIEKGVMLKTSPTSKALTLDARYINRLTGLQVRCYACLAVSGRAAFNGLNPFYDCRIKIEMNETLTPKIIVNEGFEPMPEMNYQCQYDIKLQYGSHVVPQNKMGLFQVHWMGINRKTLAENEVNAGRSISFVPARLGYEYPQGFSMYANIGVWRCLALVVYDNKYVVSGNTPTQLVVNGVYD